MLIHGFSGTRLLWESVLGALERSHDALAVNLAGHVGGPELADAPVSSTPRRWPSSIAEGST